MSNVRDFGAAGDGRTDDTAAIEHALRQGDGFLEFPRGEYRISHPITLKLDQNSRTGIHGSGGTAKLLMFAPGPTIVCQGTITGTADPHGFRPEHWQHERMPTIDGIEIEGRHPDADGIRIEGVMQPTITRSLIRRVRHGVHVTKRARNLLISHCHIYHNSGIGVLLDEVNLHQAIITGSHISYCRQGGIRLQNSEVRNLQITGNDIEYNNNRVFQVRDGDDETTAEILIDVRHKGSVREGTISGNTIQATYSPNGSNIRFIGDPIRGNHLVGMWSITGNLIGSQRVNVHLTYARGVTIVGNYLYSAYHRNLLAEHSQNIVVGANCFGHNPDYQAKELATGIRFEDCTACNISGLIVEDAQAGKHTLTDAPPIQRDGLVELVRCRQITLTGSQILDGTPAGLFLDDCQDTLVSGCLIQDRRATKLMRAAVTWRGKSSGNALVGCRLGSGLESTLDVPPSLRLDQNILDT